MAELGRDLREAPGAAAARDLEKALGEQRESMRREAAAEFESRFWDRVERGWERQQNAIERMFDRERLHSEQRLQGSGSVLKTEIRSEMAETASILRGELRIEIAEQGSELRSEMAALGARLETQIARSHTSQLRWFLLGWFSLGLTTAGLFLTARR